jgi:hypothetical protein
MAFPAQRENTGAAHRREEQIMKGKARPTHEAKKVGKTLKQKRAAKRAAHAPEHASFLPPRHPEH